ncbi:hypothetical protein TBR22_A13330 [Luteitalea sp. TBR-22]|uniref:tetratricopeptide repeat protein n=1 Tax=Luteitalea sp. TBR-22 TaxID=2802971 RepID=UPI001AF5AD0B|nr:tetratricopeptide repeat protein [Luteitalea sp. TBR-22]BCS32124.1 hypothetical protein TBR22_A13330 [Luteitalea sp. TBR-22]
MPSVRRGRIALGLVCALLAGREGPASRAQAPSTSSPASGALQRAITLVETRGDCRGALPELDIAARSTDAAVAPRALLLRGQCLERLGRPADARAAYDGLVTRFPTHPLTRQARRRAQVLAAPTKGAIAAPSLTLRRLDVGDAVHSGSLSGDGRYVAFHDSDSVPFRRDLLTGRAEKLTLGGETDGTRAEVLLLSRDGQQLAFMWEVDGRSELRLAPAVNGGAAVTLVPAGAWQAIRPVAWTPDGSTILVITTDFEFRLALQAVAVRARRLDRLAGLGFVDPFHVSLSPDGRQVLFDHANGSGPRDIVLLDLASRRLTPLVTHAANDVMPVFLPDGRSFLFASDRLGPLSLWRHPLGEDSANESTLVRRDIGRIWAVGMTPAGVFVHGLQTGMVDVHTVRLGDDGRLAEQARPVSATFAGYNQAPDWSPDGESLVYASTRGATIGGVGSRALVIRDRSTGHERLLYPDMLFFNAPRWSPDGTRILVKGRLASTNKWGEYIVDARTGAVTPVVVASQLMDETELGPHQWVPGREAILLARYGKGLVEVDLATGAEKTLVPLEPGVNITAPRGCAYAPDGRTLAWSTVERSAGRGNETVLRVREPGGSVRELLRSVGPEWLMLMDWAPDGQAVYVVRHFAARSGALPARAELWRVPIDGSAPSDMGLSAPSLRAVSVHPDGRRIAYVTGFPTWEIWALEGLK